MSKFFIFSYGAKMSNIGDQAQRVGFENALNRAGFNVNKYSTIYGYNTRLSGEKLSYIAYGYYDYNYNLDLFPIKENEHPFFLSVHCTDEKRVMELKRIEDKIPFWGCRDYATYLFMKKFFPNIPSFMTGCYSLIQNRRECVPKNGKVYCVDIQDKLKKYIPSDLKKDVVYRTHDNFRFSDIDYEADELATNYINNWFTELKTKARLVVTSRLHCALPCVAMGIPVVVARDYRDNTDRYTGYEKLFHVYMPNEYSEIDWNPEIKDIEWIKNLIVENTKAIIEAIESDCVYEKNFIELYNNKWGRLTNYFTPTEYVPYYEGENKGYLTHDEKKFFYETNQSSIIEFITGKMPQETNLVVYGAGDRGRYFLNRYADEIKKYQSFYYVDGKSSRVGNNICGIPIKNVSNLYGKANQTVVIVAIDRYYSLAGRQIAMRLANELKYREGVDFLMLDKLDSSSKLELTKAVYNAPLL